MMKPRFTTGEWNAYLDGQPLKEIENPKDYLTKTQQEEFDTPIECISAEDDKIVLGYDYKRVREDEFSEWFVEQWPQIVFENEHDVRLVELAPLLAEEVMSNYYKAHGEWWWGDGDSVDKQTSYLLVELAKLYEEEER